MKPEKRSALTRRQHEVYEWLVDNARDFGHPPTLDELCAGLGVTSRGSLHKHIQALVDAGLVEPLNGRRRGIRLSAPASAPHRLPLLGCIAAGRPIEAIAEPEWVEIPPALHTGRECYVLQVQGDSMVEDGILDGDWVVIEHREQARNGEVVVALVDGETTLKRIEQRPGEVLLHAANAAMAPLKYHPDEVRIQGVLVGQMRTYRS